LDLPATLNLTGRDLQPGQTLWVEARARDFCLPGKQGPEEKEPAGKNPAGKNVPQTGQTDRPLRLRIVSAADLLRLVRQRQSTLVERLTRTLASQQAARDRLSAWSPGLAEPAGSSAQTELVDWQRQVAEGLDHAGGRLRHRGVVQQLGALLRLYDSNRLADRETRNLLTRLRTDLTSLARQTLPALETRLHDLLLTSVPVLAKNRPAENGPAENGQSGRPGRGLEADQVIGARDALVRSQQEVIDRLQQALDDLARWNTLHQLTRQFQRLERGQRQLFERCRDGWAPQFWAESVEADARGEALPTRKQTRLSSTATSAQRQLARRAEQLIPQLEAAANGRLATQPEVARRLARVARLARQQAVQAKLQSAADRLSERQWGRALQLQQQALEILGRLRSQLLGKQRADPAEDGTRQAREDARSDSSQADRPSAGSRGNRLPGSAPAPAAGQTQLTSQNAQAPRGSVESLVQDLWGALPQRQRQQILQPMSKAYLPQYAADIAAYFRALADPAARQAAGKPARSEP